MINIKIKGYKKIVKDGKLDRIWRQNGKITHRKRKTAMECRNKFKRLKLKNIKDKKRNTNIRGENYEQMGTVFSGIAKGKRITKN